MAANLASKLGVSRTPVREALREVVALGLIEIHGNQGAFVIDPLDVPLKQLSNLVQIRVRIEP